MYFFKINRKARESYKLDWIHNPFVVDWLQSFCQFVHASLYPHWLWGWSCKLLQPKKISLDSRNLFFYKFWRSGIYNHFYFAGIKVLPGLPPLPEALREILFLDSSRFWWRPAFLDLWQHNSSLCLVVISLSPLLCEISFCLSY